MFFCDRWRKEYVEDEERAIIPKAVLKQIRVEDIPDNFEIEVCEAKEVGDVHLENYDDDGAYIHLVYSTKIYTDDMSELLSNMEQIYGEIKGAADITLGSPFSKIDDCEKENEFTIKILLSLFRKLGFINVKYNHGNKEYGKDITFARRTEFDDYEYYGV